jgi:hypothetical protein
MPTSTYVALATTELTSTATTITFSSIPATYRDLVLVLNVPSSDNLVYIKPNGSSSNLSSVRAYNVGSSLYSNTETSWADPASGTYTRFFTYNLMDYSATDKHKTVLFRQNFSTNITFMGAGRWASTTAISSLVIERETGSLPVGIEA